MPEEWTEKYRPKSLSEVIGNPKAVKELEDWARSWENGNPRNKAVILVGEPGIGKTSSALALANDFGWGVVELNASDTRNADAIRKVATLGAISETFKDTGEFVSSKVGGRKLIILDEADNLFGKEDYGGMQAIVETIKVTEQPIVLIVNNYYELTRRSSVIKELCLTIRFLRIQKNAIKSALKRICQNEGISITEEVLDIIAEHSESDLRSAINDLQSLSEGRRNITAKDVEVLGYRDTRTSIFEAITEILKTSSFEKSREITFNLDEDPEHLILWLDENLPIEYKDLVDLAMGFDALSRADVFLGRVAKKQSYELWAYANDLMTAGVSLAKKKRYTSPPKYQFPTWLRKMSASKRIRDTQKSLSDKIGVLCHTSRATVRESILSYFKALFNKDREFRTYMVSELALDEDEVAFLLDEKSDSHPVEHLLEDAKKIKVAKKEEVRVQTSEKDDEKVQKQKQLFGF